MKKLVVRYAFVEEMVVKYAFVVYNTHFFSLEWVCQAIRSTRCRPLINHPLHRPSFLKRCSTASVSIKISRLDRYQASDYGGRQRSAGPSIPAAFVGGGGLVATCDFGGAPTN